MHFHKNTDGSFTLSNKYGQFLFKNGQKYYKFQVLCKHPSSYKYDDDGAIETICERCGLLLHRQEEQKHETSLDNWCNEGGLVYD